MAKKKPFRLTPPEPFIPLELDEQIAIFDYARIAGKQDWRWNMLFSTMNGVRVSIGLAKKMKRAGNRAGVPDIILPISREGMDGHECGLFIELKRVKGGVVSDVQKQWHDNLELEGYRVRVCKGYVEAIEAVKEYLGDTA